MSSTSDPGSLSRLHDIVLPQAVSWWPLAPGWYVVCALALMVLGLTIWWSLQRWQRRRYRRRALAELQLLREGGHDPRTTATQILILLKRTALAAYPRALVAGLSGERWWAFLDQHAAGTAFVSDIGPLATQLAYGSKPAGSADDARLDEFCSAVERWIVTHREPDRD